MKTNKLPEPTESVEEEISKQAVDLFRSTKGAKVGYLCRNCAKLLGGVWPKHHVATMHGGECQICMTETTLASASDWQLNENGKPCKISSLEWD